MKRIGEKAGDVEVAVGAPEGFVEHVFPYEFSVARAGGAGLGLAQRPGDVRRRPDLALQGRVRRRRLRAGGAERTSRAFSQRRRRHRGGAWARVRTPGVPGSQVLLRLLRHKPTTRSADPAGVLGLGRRRRRRGSTCGCTASSVGPSSIPGRWRRGCSGRVSRAGRAPPSSVDPGPGGIRACRRVTGPGKLVSIRATMLQKGFRWIGQKAPTRSGARELGPGVHRLRLALREDREGRRPAGGRGTTGWPTSASRWACSAPTRP